MNESFWRIDISGYGDFCFFGTEKEAEEMRAHKARWERGTGRKRRLPKTSRIVAEYINFARREASLGAKSSVELMARIDDFISKSEAPANG